MAIFCATVSAYIADVPAYHAIASALITLTVRRLALSNYIIDSI